MNLARGQKFHFVLLLFFWLAFPRCYASYPTISINPSKELSLSPESFRRYVLPQIKSIISEFFYVIRKLQPLNGDIISIREKIYQLKVEWHEHNKTCELPSDKCTSDLSRFYNIAKTIDLKIMLLNKEVFQSKNLTADGNFDHLLVFSKYLDDLSNLNYTFLHVLENLMIRSDTGHSSFIKSNIFSDNITPLINNMLNIVESSIIDQLNIKPKDNFDLLLVFFIKKLESHVIVYNDSDYLVKNLGEFNTIWNTFHLGIEQGYKQFPHNLLSIVRIMSNRWNQILKIVLN